MNVLAISGKSAVKNKGTSHPAALTLKTWSSVLYALDFLSHHHPLQNSLAALGYSDSENVSTTHLDGRKAAGKI